MASFKSSPETPSPTVLAEALRALERPGCPACRERSLAERRWVGACVSELYAEPLVLREIGEAHGFCAKHSRLLMARLEGPFVLRGVYSEVVAVALRKLEAAAPRPTRPCPLCASSSAAAERAAWFILKALPSTPAADAYEAGSGLCLHHLLPSLPSATWNAVQILAGTAFRALRETEAGPRLIQRLAGCDGESPIRHALRGHLANSIGSPLYQAPGLPTLRWLEELVAQETCPLCLDGGLLERGYIHWLVAEARQHPEHLAGDGMRLCSSHLHDLLEEDAEAAVVLMSLIRDHAIAGLGALPDQPEAAAAGPRRSRWRRLWQALHGRESWSERLPALSRLFECSLCQAMAVRDRRVLELLLLALDDRPLLSRYACSHGLCLRHLAAIGRDERAGPAREVLRVRLRLLGWELEEAGRKGRWSFRHETRGDESTAWLRAPALFDGRAFLGGPARHQVAALRCPGLESRPLEVAP